MQREGETKGARKAGCGSRPSCCGGKVGRTQATRQRGSDNTRQCKYYLVQQTVESAAAPSCAALRPHGSIIVAITTPFPATDWCLCAIYMYPLYPRACNGRPSSSQMVTILSFIYWPLPPGRRWNMNNIMSRILGPQHQARGASPVPRQTSHPSRRLSATTIHNRLRTNPLPWGTSLVWKPCSSTGLARPGPRNLSMTRYLRYLPSSCSPT